MVSRIKYIVYLMYGIYFNVTLGSHSNVANYFFGRRLYPVQFLISFHSDLTFSVVRLLCRMIMGAAGGVPISNDNGETGCDNSRMSSDAFYHTSE